MTIEPYDNPLRVLVSSETRPDIKHLVELDAYDGLGKCSCEAFSFRSEPLANPQDGTPADRSPGLRCKHILAARDWLDLELARIELDEAERLAATFSNEPPE